MERKEIIFDGYFYDVTEFIKRHPGGSIILDYTKPGEDGTHAIQQFHHRSFDKVKKMMGSFKKRPVTDSDLHLDPQVLKKNRALSEDFTKLYKDLVREGYFEPSHTYNAVRMVELLAMWYVGYLLLQWPYKVAKYAGIFMIGFSQGRVGWVGHECGHYSFLGFPKFDRYFQMFLHGTIGGASATWWRRGHNRHHAMPQRLNHDIDLSTVPLLAYNKKVVKNNAEGKGFLIMHQTYFFPLVSPLLGGIFWRFYKVPKFLIKNRLYTEILALIAHYVIYLYLVGFWVGFFSSWMAASYIFLNFALSHTYLPVTTQPMHWVEYALVHTADVEQTRWCDYWMGFLNYQIEHHLFPAMPQFRQPLIIDRVKTLAKKHNLPYICYSYAEAIRQTYLNLHKVSQELIDAE
ncbi:acyl-lipid (8-3)-desaturase-like isoform X2 [Bradysia coprophila]|uniref:acyl-lipid (8-3)-desaturase-like isoform X2 n=1 Tax=Bradysia coprophila TaxID=38358 RepID=UPI00187D7384|nr:acyl-lipid (8-3)-desaturase-like isoform X2 [Bradysia coprophila]